MTHPKAFTKLKNYVEYKKQNRPVNLLKEENQQLSLIVKDLMETNHFVQNELKFLKKSYLDNQSQVAKTDDRINDILHRISSMNDHPVATAKKTDLFADNHILDSFYVKFENAFRGGEADIRKRLEIYLDKFTPLKDISKQFPILDIGCGRGEFIDLMLENGINVIGLDLNKSMVDRVIEKGASAHNIDALSFLRKQKSNSLSAITGFHIVEHIPFEQLLDIFNECYRVLRPGGFTLFETPNPETLVVGSCSFYMDPSHLHPIPPALLEFTMGTCGFDHSEVLRLHPRDELKETKNKLLNDIAERVFGPQDYAVISFK